jgi:formylglycine-generating enzyme required for sulfatase activity
MTNAKDNQVRIFISYAREDSARVKALYQQLADAGFQPWLDREHIIPGQQWEPVIKRALKQSDFVLVCLSATSINKRGFLRREIKQALEQAGDMLEEDVYLIPARLDDCEVPDILEHLQWVDLFEDYGWEDLLGAFAFQLQKLGKSVPQPKAVAAATPPPPAPVAAVPPPAPAKPVSSPTSTWPRLVSFTEPTVLLDERGQVRFKGMTEGLQFREDLGDGVTLDMVALEGGEFRMGSTEAEARAAWEDYKRYNSSADWDWFKRETPRHRVRVSPFCLGKFQVTQAQWQAVMGNLPEMEGEFRGARRPIINVSWNDVTAFCQRLSAKTGRVYRLPTEAEWEYACRAETTTPFAFGETITTDIVNCNGNYPYGQAPKGVYRATTVDVGSLGVANGFGLYDMHGNVWEWCQDWFDADYYAQCQKQGVAVDPTGPTNGEYRILRGGAWNGSLMFARAVFRLNPHPGFRYNFAGFRVVVVSPPSF